MERLWDEQEPGGSRDDQAHNGVSGGHGGSSGRFYHDQAHGVSAGRGGGAARRLGRGVGWPSGGGEFGVLQRKPDDPPVITGEDVLVIKHGAPYTIIVTDPGGGDGKGPKAR